MKNIALVSLLSLTIPLVTHAQTSSKPESCPMSSMVAQAGFDSVKKFNDDFFGEKWGLYKAKTSLGTKNEWSAAVVVDSAFADEQAAAAQARMVLGHVSFDGPEVGDENDWVCTAYNFDTNNPLGFYIAAVVTPTKPNPFPGAVKAFMRG